MKLNNLEILEIIKKGESDCVEFTEATNKLTKFGEAICAFSNDLPNNNVKGYLLIGVKNNGQLSGLKTTDDLLLNCANLRDQIVPLPTMTVESYSFDCGDVVVIEVTPTNTPPARYKQQVWVRVGPRKAVASAQEEHLLSEKRLSLGRNFDIQPAHDANIKELDIGLFTAYRNQAVSAETIAENHRNIEEQLAALRFFDLSTKAVTNAGIILFGSNPRYYLPGHYIQFLHFPNEDMSNPPLDQAEISGDLVSIIREMELRLRTLNTTQLKPLGEFKEGLKPTYPEEALRELFLNALTHRDYSSNTPIAVYAFSNRIEIKNPGGLYGEVNQNNFPSQNSYRNPSIAACLKDLGYVNRFGYGVFKAKRLCQENGNRLSFTLNEPSSFLVQIYKEGN